MDIAALIFWIVTAGGGFYLLGTWLAKGGARSGGAGSRFPVPLIFGHFLLAAAGLVVWIAYVATDNEATGWVDFFLLVIIALLGFTMFARWIPTYRATRAASQGPGAGSGTAGDSRVATAAAATATAAGPAERNFPVVVVAFHGVLAATTLLLVLLTMIGG